jgi:multiple sugar transport system ATP-binding protein
MKVYDNMAFSLKLAKMDAATIDERVKLAADTLNLTEFLNRYPRQLSGGQRQRVAMGRCIVRDPEVFLFDEPLSNLDAKLRVQMRTEIRALHQRLEATSVYVTHDQIEAMTMADEIVVMQAGKVEQAGPPLELYDRPSNLFVAGFIGSPAMNFLEGTLTRVNGRARVLTDDGTTLSLGSDPRASDGQRVVFGTRPEHLELVGEGEGLVADVLVVEPTGSETLMVGEMAGIQIQAAFRERHRLAPGQRIHLRPDPNHAHVFDAQSGQRL